MDSSSRKPKSLYRELTIAVVVLASLVSIAVNLLNYIYFAHETEALYERESSGYAVYLREELEWPLWNIDDELVGKIGGAFASNAEIVSLTIRDDQQRVVYQRKKPNGNQVKREIAIEHNGKNIGSVEIGLTLSVYEERERQLLLVSMATMVLLIVILLSATRWILSRLLKKPVDALVAATGDMVEGKYREIELPETYVEFAAVLSGFKTMSDAVASRERSLRQINEHLAAEIGERKHAEEALRAASLYTRSLIEASLDPLVTISVEGKITDVNQATEEVTGRSRSELIGTDFSDYFTEPDKAREGYQQAFLKGYVTNYPLVLRHRDGHITEVLYNASVYRDEAGEVLGVFAAARDVTERNKAEQEVVQLSLQNKRILDSAGEGIYGLDIDGRCTFVNPAALQLLGFRVEELIGQHSHSMFHHTRPDGHPYAQEECPVQSAYKQGAVHRGSDLYWRKDGSSFPVAFISTPIMEAGKITGAVVAFRDITELKEAEGKITELNRDLERRVAERTEQLEAANKELEAFSYSVSHDLRSPLRAIDGFSHILLDDYSDKLDDEGRRLLNVVRDNTSRMGQLIDDILKFSRTGRLELTFSEIDMKGLAREVFEELRPAVGHELQVEIGEIPPAKGDRAMMRQVFVNLLANAIKFSRSRDTIRIKVGASIEGGEAIYYVNDNGVGFDMHYAGKLFGVFQRLHSENEFEGTGIGLAIVKRIITRHGGRVWAEGKLNEGATIYFALPASEDETTHRRSQQIKTA